MDHRQTGEGGRGERGEGSDGRKTTCTSELGENPAEDVAGFPSGSLLQLHSLFSASDSDSELSSMGAFSLPLSPSPPLSLLCLLRRINPPVSVSDSKKTESHRLTFRCVDGGSRGGENKMPQVSMTGPRGSAALTNFSFFFFSTCDSPSSTPPFSPSAHL